jgi:hypothetical protein
MSVLRNSFIIVVVVSDRVSSVPENSLTSNSEKVSFTSQQPATTVPSKRVLCVLNSYIGLLHIECVKYSENHKEFFSSSAKSISSLRSMSHKL